MRFTEPVRQAEFVRRYKRFFADVKLNDAILVSHVPNTGSLKTCLFEGSPCIITESDSPTRKLKATLQFLKTPTTWVGVNTAWPNLLAFEAFESRMISDWVDFGVAQREYKLSKETRLDMVLAKDAAALAEKRGLYFIEVKNVTYGQDGIAYFPDAVTTRGQKHLRELMRLRHQGFGAEILFVVQRSDCHSFSPADDIDPEYGRLLRQAAAEGVTVRILACEIDPMVGVTLSAKPLSLTI